MMTDLTKPPRRKNILPSFNKAFAQAIFRAMYHWPLAPSEAGAESFGVELERIRHLYGVQ